MKTKKQTFVVLLAGGIVALLACGAAFVGGGGASSGGGSGITEGQAGTIASNAAKSLMVWTNDNQEIKALGVNNGAPRLFSFNQNGTNIIQVSSNGALFIGKNVHDNYSIGNLTKSFISSRSFARGDNPENGIEVAAVDDDNFNEYSAFGVRALADASAPVARLILDAQAPSGNRGRFFVQAESYDSSILLSSSNTARIFFNPTAANDAAAVAHFIDTEIAQTIGGGTLFSIRNAGTEKLNVSKDGAITSVGGFATNVATFSFITTNLLSGQVYTNLAQRGFVSATIEMTNVLAGDVSSMALIVDQNGDGTWDRTNGPVRINGTALLAGSQQLIGKLQPNSRFAYTNQSAGVTPGSAEIRVGSCEWGRE